MITTIQPLRNIHCLFVSIQSGRFNPDYVDLYYKE